MKSSILTLPRAREKFRGDPPGTKMRLTVRSGSALREITVTLRDLIEPAGGETRAAAIRLERTGELLPPIRMNG